MRLKLYDCEDSFNKKNSLLNLKLTSCAFGCSWLQIFLVCSSDKAKVDSMNIDCSSSSSETNCEQEIFLRKTFPKYFSLSISFGRNQSTLFTTRHFFTRKLTSREWNILLATTRTSDTELNNFSRLIHDFFYLHFVLFNPKYLVRTVSMCWCENKIVWVVQHKPPNIKAG